VRLVVFFTDGDTSIYVNPDQVTTVESYTEGDGRVVTHIKTVNMSATVKEPVDVVVSKLTNHL